MFDLSKPISVEVLLMAIAIIVALVGVGLAVVSYYKKKLEK